MNKKTLLIVDDEEVLRKSLSKYYEIDGYTIVEACNGKDALSVLKNHDVDFVISDVRMPHGDGEFLLKELRKVDSKDPPVVLLSGFSELTKEQAQGLGAIDLLEKPINYELLDELIENNI